MSQDPMEHLTPEMIGLVQEQISTRMNAITEALVAAGVPNDDITVAAMMSFMVSRFMTHLMYVEMGKMGTAQATAQADPAKKLVLP